MRKFEEDQRVEVIDNKLDISLNAGFYKVGDKGIIIAITKRMSYLVRFDNGKGYYVLEGSLKEVTDEKIIN